MIGLLALVSLPALAANEAEQNNDNNPSALDTVEVSATSVGRGSNVENMDVSTTVITKEQIQKSPELSIDQLLNRQMGVWTSQTLANQQDFTSAVVGIRGFGNKGGEKVLVMVDGVPINDGIFKTIDWNQVPKDTIEKIEIIRGGGGATLWGNLAEGGVINIVTREPKADEKRIGFAYGSFNTKVGDASATLFRNDKLKVGLNLNTVESDGYNTAPKNLQVNRHIVPTDSRTHNALLSTYYTPSDTQKYYLKLNGHELLQDHANFDVANNQWYKYNAKTGGQIKYSDSGSFNFNGFYDFSQMNKVNGSLINVGSGAINVNNIGTIIGAGAMPSQKEAMYAKQYGLTTYVQEEFNTAFGSFKDIKLGMDARGIDAIDNNNVYKQIANNGNGYTNLGKFNWEGQNYFEGIFAQATYSPNDIPLDVNLGLRQDWWQSVNANGYTQLAGAAQKNLNLKSQRFEQFNPRMGIKYSFENGIDIRAAAYRNFAAPGMNALFRSFAGSTTGQTGNPELVPETNFGQEIGIDFTGKTIKTKLTLFHNKLDNYISSVKLCSSAATCNGLNAQYGFSNANTQISQNQNIGSAVMEGGEAFVEWQALDTLKLNASVVRTIAFADSFNSTFTRLNTGTTPLMLSSKQLPDVPYLVLTLGGEWKILPNLDFGWSIKSWPSYWSSTLQNYNATYAAEQQGATTADLNLSYQATKNLNLYVMAQNVSNANYIANNRDSSSSTIPTMGMPRNILGGFKLEF